MGKTTLARSLASAWPQDRVFVHDPKDQFPEYDLVDPGVLQSPGSLVIIDEAHRVARPTGYAKGWEWLQILVHEGRHHGLTAIFCARRPAVVHYDLRAIVEACYVGRITSSRDMEALIRDVDEDCARCGALEQGQFLVFYP
jgi:ERCC4-related helicase